LQVVVNERFLKRRATFSRVGTWGGLAALALSFGVSFFPEFLLIAWVFMVVGLTAFNMGRYNNVRWVSRPREDEVLAYGLKGLDHNHHLLNYLPQTQVGHILVAPSAVYVLHLRRQDGQITHEGSRWSRKPSIGIFLRAMIEGTLGNPTNDAVREAQAVHRFLSNHFTPEEMEELNLQPLIVFIDPRVKLTVRDPLVPVLTTKDLKSYMRKQQKVQRVSSEEMNRILKAFGIRE
jgi:hypothetical protein